MDFQEAYPDTCSTVSRAAGTGNVEILKNLIKAGKPIDIKDNRGWQSLHEAAFHGHVKCLRIILKKGAEVDCRTFEEQTPLMLACKGGHTQCVAGLLKAGADPNSKTHEDFTPLWEATIKKSLGCVKLLISAGAQVNTQNFTLDTPLHGLVQQKDEDMDIVRYLVDSGADLTIQNECGLTPLFIASQFGLVNCLQYFIEYAESKGQKYRVDLVNKPADDDATPLFLATQNEHVRCVKPLLDNGADPNRGIANPEKRLEFQILPLHMALFKANKECVSKLVTGTSSESFTWENNCYDQGSGYNYNPVAIAASLDSEDCLKLLLKQPFFQNLFSGEHNAKFLAENNLFSFGTKIRPAVLITKKFKTFVENCFRLNKLVLHKCIICILEDGMEYFPVFLLMLRLGAAVDFPRHWLDHVGMAGCALPYFCAMVKYSARETSCGKCARNSSNFQVTNNSSVYTCPVRRPAIRKLQLLLATEAQSDVREKCLREQLKEHYKAIIQSDELNNLQNICRRTIILQMLRGTGYTRTTVMNLQIPKLIKNFLLFEEEKSFSDIVLNAFERLEKEENDLDKIFADVCID